MKAVNQELMKIPLEYFNETLDSSYATYSALNEREKALLREKEKMAGMMSVPMWLEKMKAIDGALAKCRKAKCDRSAILKGFMSVTVAMCEERTRNIKVQTDRPGEYPQEVLDSLKYEELGIVEYLAKIKQYKEYMENAGDLEDNQDEEGAPESI